MPEPPSDPHLLSFERPRRRRADERIFVLSAALLGAGLLYLLVLAVAGADIAAALPLLVGVWLGGFLAMAGWHRDRMAAVGAAEGEDRARLRTRELQRDIMRMHFGEQSGDPGDVRALILQVAVALLEAEKGLLIAYRTDSQGEKGLHLVSALGFQHDPEESALAHRFAQRVIARDAAVVEDRVPATSGEVSTPADAEIENLVAIPIYIQDEFSGVVICANRAGGFGAYDEEVLLSLGDHAGAVLQNNQLRGELRDSYVTTVRMLVDALRAKDPLAGGHSEEVSSYVARVADRLGIDAVRRERLLFASMLHDIGKIGISEKILLKPGALTDEERALIELHPRIGYRLVEQVGALRDLADAILHHHERVDGTGYPDGLAGSEISLDARIISVADSYSAMTADRPYRGKLSVDEACSELERCAGKQFDDEVVRIFVDEVRNHPAATRPNPLDVALDDPELARARRGDEPMLGHGRAA